MTLYPPQSLLSTTYLTSFDLSEVVTSSGGLPPELSQSTPISRSYYHCHATNPLECQENGPSCSLGVTQFMMNDTNFSIVISFSEPTNQPPIPTLQTLATMIESVPYIDLCDMAATVAAPSPASSSSSSDSGLDGTAQDRSLLPLNTTWVNPSTLEVACPPNLFWRLYQAALGGMVFRAKPKECPSMVYKGGVDLRLNEAGHYALAFSYQADGGGGVKMFRGRLVGPFRSQVIPVRQCESLLVHIDHGRDQPKQVLEGTLW